MKTISKEEIESYIGSLQSGSFEGWTPGEVNGYNTACNSIKSFIDQLQPPQSGEVMTLEECKDKYAEESGFNDFYDYIKNSTTGEIDHHCSHIAELYAKAKSDQLQARVDDLVLLKEHLEAKSASLMLSLREEELQNEKFREALSKIIKSDWTDEGCFGLSSAQLHNRSIKLAEQAL